MRAHLSATDPLRRGRFRVGAVVGGLMLVLSACSSASPDAATVDAPSATVAIADCEPGGASSEVAEAAGLPDLRLPCMGAGPAVELSALTGRPTLVNLWATWCGPCREEMPLLEQAFQAHGDVVRFLGVDTRDKSASATDFLAATGVTYPQAVDGDGQLLTDLGLPGLPVTLAIDPTGRVITTQIGQMTPTKLETLLQQLVASASPTPAN